MRRVLVLAMLVVTACGGDDDDASPAGVTWYRDVLPIAQDHCMSCHRDGGIGPFSMESYESAVNYAGMMAEQVASHTMPPWPPTADCVPLSGARVISEADIDTIVAWADAGAPAGDPADAPGEPAPVDSLDSVDLVVEPAAPYTPRAGRPDDYHCFLVDPGLTEDRDVIAYQVVPGVPAEVHHVILFRAAAADAQAADDAEDGEGWTCFGDSGVSDASMVGGWAPGTRVTRYPDGVGIAIGAADALVMQVHYNLANVADEGPVPDLTRVELDLADGRVPRAGFFYSVADHGFAIPAGAEAWTSSATDVADGPVDVWGVYPHMHTLGRSIRVDAVLGGEERCIVDIPSWSFHWQQLYLFETPIAADPGDSGTVTCTWDNPTDEIVRWGEGTSDEMCLNFYLLTER